MSASNPAMELHHNPANLWSRLRTTFGPAVVGLVGGSMSGLIMLSAYSAACRQMAADYEKFPTLNPPWTAVDWELDGSLAVVGAIIGIVALFAMGPISAWLVRARDIWGDLSAGMTTALAATLSALVASVGWTTLIWFALVPSVDDLKLLRGAPPPAADVSHTADALVQCYPDLESVEPEKRRLAVHCKIVTDQATGCATALGLGVLIAFGSAGMMALGGTLAGGVLLRQGNRIVVTIVSYLEMTVPPTITVLLGVAFGFSWSEFGTPEHMTAMVAMMCVWSVMLVGVTQRWPGVMRWFLAATWFVLPLASGELFGLLFVVGLSSWTIYLLVRHRFTALGSVELEKHASWLGPAIIVLAQCAFIGHHWYHWANVAFAATVVSMVCVWLVMYLGAAHRRAKMLRWCLAVVTFSLPMVAIHGDVPDLLFGAYIASCMIGLLVVHCFPRSKRAEAIGLAC